MENPCVVLPQIRHFLPHCFSQLDQDFDVVLMLNRLTLRYPFNSNDAPDIEETYKHHLQFRLAHSRFFILDSSTTVFQASISSWFPDRTEKFMNRHM